MNNQSEKEILKRTYINLLLPAVFLIVLVYLGQFLNILNKEQIQSVRIVSIILFTLGALFSFALPIFLRASFVNKVKDLKQVTIDQFITFEKKLLSVVMLSPYVVFLAVIFNIPNFYLSGTVLFGLYAVYYYYPSEKRIKFERKIFKVK